jgi:transcriptional regulator with XRE-family HTH domain
MLFAAMTPRRSPTLGDHLRAARLAVRLPMNVLGPLLGVSAVAIGRWERDEFTPSYAARQAIVAWARSLAPPTGDALLRALGAEVAAPKVTPPSASRAEADRATNDALLTMAETLDVGPRSLRRALGALIAEMEARGAGLESLKAVAARGGEARKRQES